MGDDQNNPPRYQRGRDRWIRYLFPLAFLLIFAFTQSLAGLLVSLAIIVLLWVIIAAAPLRSRPGNAPPIQQSPSPQLLAALPPQAHPYPQGPGISEESDRLARLKLLGELHRSGILTDDEFAYQKRRVLQTAEPKEATEAEAASARVPETGDEGQQQVHYLQELPPMPQE